MLAADRSGPLRLERGGHGCEPKGGLTSRPLTKPPENHRQLSQISPLSLSGPDLTAELMVNLVVWVEMYLVRTQAYLVSVCCIALGYLQKY